MNVFGMKIVESPLIQPVQKVKLSRKCPCSDQVRDDFNAWLLGMFGDYLPCYIIGGGQIVMHPKHIALLRADPSALRAADFLPSNVRGEGQPEAEAPIAEIL
jgi:hypothetical protein